MAADSRALAGARAAAPERPSAPLMLLPPVVLTGILWLTQLNPVSPTQAGLALILAFIPWWTFQHWRRAGDTRFPLFAAIAFVYWLYYAVPLFWGDRLRPTLGPETNVSDVGITGAMVMVALGVTVAWLGWRSGLGRRLRLPRFVDFRPFDEALPYVRVVLVFSTLFSLALTLGLGAPDAIRQIVLDLQLHIPLLAYVIVLRAVMRRQGSPVDIWLLAGYGLVDVLNGVYQSQLGLVVTPALATLLVYIWDRRRIPTLPILAGLLLILFLQPTKVLIRKQYNQALAVGAQVSAIDRAQSWLSTSVDAWRYAVENPGSGAGLSLVRTSVQRTSLLQQTAHVLDWTPQYVPFQNGTTYSYLPVSLVPRFLWPDKPSFNDANQWYQLAYGLATPATLSNASIAAGSLTEGYFNFGWPGVIGVMFLLGIIFDFVAASLLTTEVGEFLGALGILATMQFLIIESQLGVYLSGIVETSLLAIVIFFPALRFWPDRQRT